MVKAWAWLGLAWGRRNARPIANAPSSVSCQSTWKKSWPLVLVSPTPLTSPSPPAYASNNPRTCGCRSRATFRSWTTFWATQTRQRSGLEILGLYYLNWPIRIDIGVSLILYHITLARIQYYDWSIQRKRIKYFEPWKTLFFGAVEHFIVAGSLFDVSATLLSPLFHFLTETDRVKARVWNSFAWR